MINFLADNLATILISLALIGIVALIIRKLAKDKKAGRSFCAMCTERKAALPAPFPKT